MKMKQLLVITTMLFSLNVFAAVEVDTTGLTNAQKATLVQQAEQFKKESTNMSSAEQVDQWVNVGERIGKMMGGAAKEVGIAVNEFVKTPVGKMTAAVIVWNYMGSMIVHVVSGLFVLICSWGLLTWYGRRATSMVVEYHPTERNWLGQAVLVSKKRGSLDSDIWLGLITGYLISLLLSIFIIFSW